MESVTALRIAAAIEAAELVKNLIHMPGKVSAIDTAFVRGSALFTPNHLAIT